jgi:hypothetical protein
MFGKMFGDVWQNVWTCLEMFGKMFGDVWQTCLDMFLECLAGLANLIGLKLTF